MSNIITGLFNNQRDYKKLETDLENSGFSNSDYIVYLNEDVNANYMASVVIKTDSDAEKAQTGFRSE
jgi:virulence-associated protein VapD